MTPYKAWDVFRLHGDSVEHEIAYADSRNEAKYKVLDHECKTDGEFPKEPVSISEGVADDVDESLLQRLGWIFNRVSMLISDLRGEE